ncbi:MAG: phage tail sheath family protein [Proteobacteria bacterium]|nr:phage tail sheath family protein [Pseudomonadota bacterium]
MPDRYKPGILVEESVAPEQPIENAAAAIAAFVGRTLRGPLNLPTEVNSFRDFNETFGSLWRSSPLSFAVEQYFLQGGRQAIIVRVINGGSSATIEIPCGEEMLTLEARSPGAHEALRVSVDYDNIEDDNEQLFNIVIQRLRDRHSAIVADQEIYRCVGVKENDSANIANVLLDSDLVRVIGEVPSQRPDRTVKNSVMAEVAYLGVSAKGSDGSETSDYDLIGSAAEATGMHALQKIPCFNFLVLPPHARGEGPGPVALLAAARLCRQRGAILLTDPDAAWSNPTEAIAGFRRLNFASDNAVMFYPWLKMINRLTGKTEDFPPSGAMAGYLARASADGKVWRKPEETQVLLRGGIRISRIVPDDQAVHLRAMGVNVLGQYGSLVQTGSRLMTLGPGPGGSRSLGARRVLQQTIESIRQGTRWIVFQKNDEQLWEKVRLQVEAYLAKIHREGAFPAARQRQAWFVLCGPKTHSETDLAEGALNIIVALATVRPGQFIIYRIRHLIGRSDVTRVIGLDLESINYLSG